MNQLIPNNPTRNNLATALELGWLDLNPFEQHFSDAVGAEEPRDYYRFSLQASSLVTLNLDGLTANANLFLGDGQGNVIFKSINSGSDSELIAQSLAPGNYYILVNSPQLDGYPATTYNLTLSAQFLTNHVEVSPSTISLPDPEFDQIGHRVTWTDHQGNLWVAPASSETGDFILRQAVLIDTGLASTRLNGPEWVYTQDGSEILYTKIIEGSRFLGHARWDGSQWEAGLLTDATGQPIAGFSPFGTLNPQDSSPLINYFTDRGSAWLELRNPNIGGSLPGSGARWVEGESAILVYERVDGISQVFKYDVYTGIQTQLTFDNTNKERNAFMWKAPEFNNEQLFLTGEVLDSAPGPTVQQIGIYRQIEGEWLKIRTIQSPVAELPFINSHEIFVYNDRTYIVMVLTSQGLDGKMSLQDSEVWIAGIDLEFNFYRQLTQDANIGGNADPEIFMTETGAFVYYNIYRFPVITYKADTGLGIPLPQYNDIFGTSEADTLIGTTGNDRLIGGIGSDTLAGGGGNDLFIYQNAQEGRDIITDFEVGEDKIDLTQVFSNLGYRGNTPYQDGYLQIFDSSAGEGAITRIDPDGKMGAASFTPLVMVAEIDAATLLGLNSILV